MFVKRVAFTEDLPALHAIWRAAFPADTAEQRDLFFDAVPPDRCLIAEADGVPVSMVYSLPAALGERRLQYIYAAATLPEYRGRGIFAELLRYALKAAESAGCVGSFLHPAEPSLTAYYARFGYHPWTFCERVSGRAGTAVPVTRLSPEAYSRRTVPPYALAWPKELLRYAAQSSAAYAVGDTVALCETVEDTLLVKEWSGGDAAGLCAALGCLRYEWVRPAVAGEVYTMLLPFTDDPLPPPYIGPVLD